MPPLSQSLPALLIGLILLTYWLRVLYMVRRTGDTTWSDERPLTRRGGSWATFSGDGGQFRFAFVRRHRALRKALETGAPHISLEQRWDPNCAG